MDTTSKYVWFSKRIFSNECIIRAEEFEFQWWDHAFNKAAKSVKVEEGKDGQVKVDFNSSKDELSTKKIRRKAEKAMKKEVLNLITVSMTHPPFPST